MTRNPRKAILVISDGGDNNSRYSSGQIQSLVREADVQLYAMGMVDLDEDPRRRTSEELRGPDLLSALAEMTGGHHYPVMNLDEESVRGALRSLDEKGLARPADNWDSRVSKYEHRLQEALNLTRPETAVLCVLLLRGPQTIYAGNRAECRGMFRYDP